MTADEAPPIEDIEVPPPPAPRWKGLVPKLVPALWIVLVVASVSLLAVLVYTQYRPDREMNESAAQSALDAATDGAVAVLTYSSGNFDRDVSSARSHLTGDFLAQYDQYIQTAVAPIAREKSIQTSATVVRKAVAELEPDSAAVLLYINQTTTTADNPAPSQAASSVMVRLTKVDGKWLISSFTPV